MVAVTARWLTLSIKYGRLIPVEEGDPRFLPPHILRASSDEARALVPEGYTDRGGGRYVRLPCSPDNTLGIHSKVRAAILATSGGLSAIDLSTAVLLLDV